MLARPLNNAANEIVKSSIRHDGATPTPSPVPFSYDDAGNIKSAQMETTNPSVPNLVNREYIHDAWNRLVEVIHNNGTTSGSDDFTLARYRYNGLHWRVWKQANMADAPAYATPTAQPMQRRAMFYDASWRLIHQEMDDGVDPASSQGTWTPDRAEQLFWGARYIDDAVGRRRSTAIADADDPAPTVTWGALQHYLTDAQFSVVALMDSTAAAGFDIIERVKYDPYGRAVHCQKGDYNGDGQTSVQDIFNHQANYFAANLAGDANRSGTITVQDIFDYQTLYFAPGKDAPGDQVSSPDVANGGNDNCVGYCGYIHNPETGDYTVRFRTYLPSLGRWGERDPEVYVEGLNTYQYARGLPTLRIDPSGMVSSGPYDSGDPVLLKKLLDDFPADGTSAEKCQAAMKQWLKSSMAELYWQRKYSRCRKHQPLIPANAPLDEVPQGLVSLAISACFNILDRPDRIGGGGSIGLRISGYLWDARDAWAALRQEKRDWNRAIAAAASATGTYCAGDRAARRLAIIDKTASRARLAMTGAKGSAKAGGICMAVDLYLDSVIYLQEKNDLARGHENDCDFMKRLARTHHDAAFYSWYRGQTPCREACRCKSERP